jgi:hypothetical protein
MVRTAEAAAREAKIAELKRLITSTHYDSLEKLEEAVEAFLWGEEQGASDVGAAVASLALPIPLELSTPLELPMSLAHAKPR